MMTPRPTIVSAPSRRTVLFGFSAFGAAALTGCVPLSSSKKAEESPSDTATTTSASSSSSPSHSTYSPSTSASSSSSGSSSPVDPAQFIADWQKYVGDAKLPTKGDSGYVPATGSSPAQNVPEPDINEEASRKNTLEGSYQTLLAFQSAFNYLSLTGKDEPIKKLIFPQDFSMKLEVEKHHNLYSSKGWIEGYNRSVKISDHRPAVAFSDTVIGVSWYFSESYEKFIVHQAGGTNEEVPARTSEGIMTTIYENGVWKVISNDYLKQHYSYLTSQGREKGGH